VAGFSDPYLSALVRSKKFCFFPDHGSLSGLNKKGAAVKPRLAFYKAEDQR
jgi:hypothetical protein